MRRALALVCGLALLLLAGCATRGGVAVEGRANQVTPPPSAPTLPSGTPASADPVAVVRADPLVDAKIKAGLVPCKGGFYPTDDRYVDITGDGEAELVLTLLNCPGDERLKSGAAGVMIGPGYAGYVYNLATTPPTQLLGVDGGAGVDLVPITGRSNDVAVLRSAWAPRDDPCCPTDQTFHLYRWDGTKLVEVPK